MDTIGAWCVCLPGCGRGCLLGHLLACYRIAKLCNLYTKICLALKSPQQHVHGYNA